MFYTKFKIVLYLFIGLAVQHLYNVLFPGKSGGGIAMVVFVVLGRLDDGFTVLEIGPHHGSHGKHKKNRG